MCDWDDREEKFIKVEGIIRQQIKAWAIYTSLLIYFLHIFALRYVFLMSVILFDHCSRCPFSQVCNHFMPWHYRLIPLLHWKSGETSFDLCNLYRERDLCNLYRNELMVIRKPRFAKHDVLTFFILF